MSAPPLSNVIILGINAFHPDASAAIVVDGQTRFAIAEERLNRVKHYGGFPALAINACLRSVGAQVGDVDCIAVARANDHELPNEVHALLSDPVRGRFFGELRALRTPLWQAIARLVARATSVPVEAVRAKVQRVEHHVAHTASAFFASGWPSAAGLSYDASGDLVSVLMSACQGADIRPLRRRLLPYSLGVLYAEMSHHLGFGRFGGEGTLMGLAAYGEPTQTKAIRGLLRESAYDLLVASLEGDGPNAVLREVLGPARPPRAEVTRAHMNLAASTQSVFEDELFSLCEQLHGLVESDSLVTAGGGALNSVANGKLRQRTPFSRVWTQPAASDEGLALGAALHTWRGILGGEPSAPMRHAALGPEYSEAEVRAALADTAWTPIELGDSAAAWAAERIARGEIVGWFQGRMEWGPRALGSRSLLAHPGRADTRARLNARIKHREWFRPFAASVALGRHSELFDCDAPSPFMLEVVPVRSEFREALGAVTHVDGTCRIQTVSADEQPAFHRLLFELDALIGVPAVLNTSFNEREPIVCSPADAIACFTRTDIDNVVLGSIGLSRGPEAALRPHGD